MFNVPWQSFFLNHTFLFDNNNKRAKIKESEKRIMYLDLARELKKRWNMKVMMMPIVIGVLGTVTQRLSKETERVGSL